jgi:IS30 family transposase
VKTLKKIYASYGNIGNAAFKSTTGDNGVEFAGLKGAVECAVYFCHPYASFEK